MARRSIAWLLLIAVSACNQASAAAPDPAKDLDCSVLAFYFHGYAKHIDAPTHQRHATRMVFEWYAARIREQANARWFGSAAYLADADPLLQAIKRDPRSMHDVYIACSTRAIDDPKFERFAKSFERQSPSAPPR